MSAPPALAGAAQIVEHQGHDPSSWNGARRAMKLVCNPPCEEPQLSLFDELHELARKSAVAMPAEAAT